MHPTDIVIPWHNEASLVWQFVTPANSGRHLVVPTVFHAELMSQDKNSPTPTAD